MAEYSWLTIDHTGYVSLLGSEKEALNFLQDNIDYLNANKELIDTVDTSFCTVAEVRYRIHGNPDGSYGWRER